MKKQEAGENCITRNFIICTFQQTLIRTMRFAGHAARMGQMRNSLGDLGVDGMIVLKLMLKK
jgi:hypothetical protein